MEDKKIEEKKSFLKNTNKPDFAEHSSQLKNSENKVSPVNGAGGEMTLTDQEASSLCCCLTDILSFVEKFDIPAKEKAELESKLLNAVQVFRKNPYLSGKVGDKWQKTEEAKREEERKEQEKAEELKKQEHEKQSKPF